MRRIVVGIVTGALVLSGSAVAHAEEGIGATRLIVRREIARFGWGLTAGADGFGKLSLHLDGLSTRGSLGPHHRHFTSVGRMDGTFDFRQGDAPLNRVRLRGLDVLVLYSEDHVGYYARHESEWVPDDDHQAHVVDAGFAFHFLDDPLDPDSGYLAGTFGLGWDSLQIADTTEAGLFVPVGVRVLTDPSAAGWIEATATAIVRTHGRENNHGGRIETIGRLRVHRGRFTSASVFASYRAAIEPKRFQEIGRRAEHLAAAGMEGSF